jgi:lipoprotein NlpD
MHSPSSYCLLTSRYRFPLTLVAIALLVTGCATRRPAPVEDRVASRARPAVATPPVASAVDARPPATYTVKRGDTLHQIALDSGLDYRELAAWNNIENVNRIFPGQVLQLAAPGASAPVPTQAASDGVTTAPLRTPPAIIEGKPPGPATAPVTSSPPVPASTTSAQSGAAVSAAVGAGNVKTSPKAVKEPYSERAVHELDLAASAAPAPADALALAAPGAVRNDAKPELRAPAQSLPSSPSFASPPGPSPAPAASPAPSASTGPAATNSADADQLDWTWPAKGRVVAGFSETANLKGIDIAGTAGEAVRASAPGRVVYAGSGLRGYGKLIIIKHNGTYLSAYAHNREILVKEGQQVTRGQKIAEMGNSDADQVKLHFEIRRHGKPIDPAKFLPPV